MMQQDYTSYTTTDQQTWSTLYNRQIKKALTCAHPSFLDGLHLLQLSADRIPDFNDINTRLQARTGWSLYGVPGLIDNDYFFTQLQSRRFGATTWMRSPEQIDYLEEPDLFHDVFGHVPQLAHPEICKYLQGLAAIANDYARHPAVIEIIARLYWYSIEFGLIQENRELEIYGAGILSSVSETDYALSGKPALIAFDLSKIIHTPYIKDAFQQQYFVIRSLKELTAALVELQHYCRKNFANRPSTHPSSNKIKNIQ